jgi:hypothetical protein
MFSQSAVGKIDMDRIIKNVPVEVSAWAGCWAGCLIDCLTGCLTA